MLASSVMGLWNVDGASTNLKYLPNQPSLKNVTVGPVQFIRCQCDFVSSVCFTQIYKSPIVAFQGRHEIHPVAPPNILLFRYCIWRRRWRLHGFYLPRIVISIAASLTRRGLWEESLHHQLRVPGCPKTLNERVVMDLFVIFGTCIRNVERCDAGVWPLTQCRLMM